MLLDDPAGATDTAAVPWGSRIYLVAVALAVVALGVAWDPLTAAAERAAATFR